VRDAALIEDLVIPCRVHDFSLLVRAPEERTDVVVGPLAVMPREPLAQGGCLLLDATLPRAAAEALAAFAARALRSPAAPVLLAGGESLKDLMTAASIYDALFTRGLGRDALLVAAGGGALLDACAFVAATYLRGVPFAAVPTTLLAQVDAALGGKCGLNAGGAKNQVGVIRQPRFLFADPAFAAALPAEAFTSGLGELAKTALLEGAGLHALVTRRAGALLARDAAALEEAVVLALRFKAAVVERDPLDRGERAILNAGHTVGHALEAAALRRGVALPHGDAVAIGLVVEARAVPGADSAGVEAVVRGLGLPSDLPFRPDAAEARALIERDKKRRPGGVAIPVIEAPGKVALREVDPDVLVSALARSA
jgi:3-dehydroquinate synthetase